MRTEKIFCDNCSVEIPIGSSLPEMTTDFTELDGTLTWFEAWPRWDVSTIDLCNHCICRLVIRAGEDALKKCDPALNAGGES